MKQHFNNAGVAQRQASVVALPDAELANEVAFIRSDFKGWMREGFDLRPHQEQQLDLLPAPFTERLANAIADHYERRIPVEFYKETRDDNDDDDLKDLILNGLDQVTFTPGPAPGIAVPELSIWIGYKKRI